MGQAKITLAMEPHLVRPFSDEVIARLSRFPWLIHTMMWSTAGDAPYYVGMCWDRREGIGLLWK